MFKRSTSPTLLVSLLLGAQLSWANFDVPTGTYELEKTHAYITFSYNHLGFSTPHLSFDAFDVTLEADAEKPENSGVTVTIEAASINSRVEEFDQHLVGADYFDVENFPTITFKSSDMTPVADNVYEVQGELTIKGVTKPLVLEATINKAGNHPLRNVPTIGLNATGTLSRSAWGLGNYVPVVGDEVTLDITVEMIKAE